MPVMFAVMREGRQRRRRSQPVSGTWEISCGDMPELVQVYPWLVEG